MVALLGPIIRRSFLYLIKTIGDLRRVTDCAIARYGPRGGCPNNNRGFGQTLCKRPAFFSDSRMMGASSRLFYGKLHIDRRALDLFVFDFRLGERGALDH